MPFTFSHPAAILPLTFLPSRWISLTGLIIGSITPDFEYFIRMKIYSSVSHTWIGMFWFDLPLAILLSLIFHLVVRNSLFEHLPNVLRTRVYQFKNSNWIYYLKNNFLVFIISALVGIASHIFWDSFTHSDGYMVRSIEILNNSVFIGDYSVPVYKIWQHASTLIGGLFVLYALFQLPKTETPRKQQSSTRFWSVIVIIIILVIVIKLLTSLDYKVWGNIIVTAITGLCLALIFAPIITGKKG